VAGQFGDGIHSSVSSVRTTNIWRGNVALPRPHKVDRAAIPGS
jgi:hypothetical protein